MLGIFDPQIPFVANKYFKKITNSIYLGLFIIEKQMLKLKSIMKGLVT